MAKSRIQPTAQELAAGSPAYRMASATPKPDGNRAQRRAWAKLAKRKMPAAPSTSEESHA